MINLPSDQEIELVEQTEHGIPSPHAVICKVHGQQFLTKVQYSQQLMQADDYWYCPICGKTAEWDDYNYDMYDDTYDWEQN